MKSRPRVLFDSSLLGAIRKAAEGTDGLSRLIVWERAFRHYPPAEKFRIEKLPERARRLAFLHALRGLDAARALELAQAMLRATPTSFPGKVAWTESLAQVYDWCFGAAGGVEAELGAKLEACASMVSPSTAAEAAHAAAALLAAGAALEGDVGEKLFERGENAARQALEGAALVPLEGLESLARAERVARICRGGLQGVRERLETLSPPPELPPALAGLFGRPHGLGRGSGVYRLVFAVRT